MARSRRIRCFGRAVVACAVFVPMSRAGDGVVIETVVIGEAGNPADTNGRGSIDREFRMGLFEVTNAQYIGFLRAVATVSDPNGLYNTLMETSDRGGIVRTGSPGAFVYTLKPSFGDKPVGSVSWFDAARFCNWLHNGQPAGPQDATTTEDGAYDMSRPSDQIGRNEGALWFLPTHNEWYKAAYYDPFDPGADAGGTPDYWLYPTRSDASPVRATATATGDVANPGPNVANTDRGADWNEENGNVTTVGSAMALNPWGLADIAGNINEMTETLDVPIPANPPGQPEPLPTRTIRGGDFASATILASSPEPFAPGLNMLAEGANVGFRVAASMAAVCPGDCDGSGTVDFNDLVAMLFEFGPGVGACDADGSGVIDFNDLVAALFLFGACE